MRRIGLLSDTHSWLDPALVRHFLACDEVWHAGDIGSEEVCKAFASFPVFRAVSGNIDGSAIRSTYPEVQAFTVEGLKVVIIHIGGAPGNYFPEARKVIEAEKPGLFICGHSHICKVMRDEKYKFIYMNPGACGKHGFHKFRTAARFVVDEGKIREVEIIELGLRGERTVDS